MQILIDIVTSPLTWEMVGLVCAISLLCAKPIRQFCGSWLQKNQTKITQEIQSAVKLEEDAQSLLAQYKEQADEQKAQTRQLNQQAQQELNELKTNMEARKKSALKSQEEATSAHIRLIATQHQHKIMSGMLEKFAQKTENAFKKQKSENMDAVLDHLLTSLDNNPDFVNRI